MPRLLSVIVGNVYPGREHVEFMLRNLAAQTFKDFDVVLVDSCYEENAMWVAELASLRGLKVVHTPSCQAAHVGRWFHWELYSNALLLADSRWVFHFGVHRYLHRDGLARVAEGAAAETCVVFAQRNVEIDAGGVDLNRVEEQMTMNASVSPMPTLSQSGFFSIEKDVLIQRLNGHNEALLLHHWADTDLSERAQHVNLNVRVAHDGLLRLKRDGHYEKARVTQPVCDPAQNPNCVAALMNGLREVRVIQGSVERFTHAGFEWVRCARCGTFGVENPEAYVARLRNPALVRAPINVRGVGRNLATVDADLKTLVSLAEKVELITASHENERYLV